MAIAFRGVKNCIVNEYSETPLDLRFQRGGCHEFERKRSARYCAVVGGAVVG